MKHVIAIVLALGFAGASAAAVPVTKEASGIKWACGGFGVEGREKLAQLVPQSNLKLVFDAGRRGAYITGVVAVLQPLDEHGAPALTMENAGPMCLLSVPAGRYRVEATYKGWRRGATVTASETAGKPQRAIVNFPAL